MFFGICFICALACIASYLIGHSFGRKKGAEEMEAVYKGIAREMKRGEHVTPLNDLPRIIVKTGYPGLKEVLIMFKVRCFSITETKSVNSISYTVQFEPVLDPKNPFQVRFHGHTLDFTFKEKPSFEVGKIYDLSLEMT